MFSWLKGHQAILWSVGGASVVMFVGSLALLPYLVVRIPPDYFAHAKRPPSGWAHHSAALRVILHVAKNLLGAVLMLAGVAMLVLPGQGLLTLLMGFLLVDFPGKYRLERWLFARPIVRRPINWLRHRAGRVPLQLQ